MFKEFDHKDNKQYLECHIVNCQMANTSNVNRTFHEMHLVYVSIERNVFRSNDNMNFHYSVRVVR